VDPPEVPLNRTVRFTVRLKWTGARGQVEVRDVEQPFCTGLKVVSSSQANRTENDGSGPVGSATPSPQVAVQEITFILQPEELGLATIKPLGVKYRFTATGNEQTLYTTRQTVQVVDPVREGPPRNWLLGGLLIGVGLLLLAAIGGILARQRRAAQTPPEEAREPTPAERARAALEEAKDLRIAGRVKDYHALLAATVRQFLAERYGLPAREQPTEPLLSSLEAADPPGLTPERLARVREVLEACDLVKFAGAVPDGAALERVWQQARELMVDD
jgi:hypothetical protein